MIFLNCIFIKKKTVTVLSSKLKAIARNTWEFTTHKIKMWKVQSLAMFQLTQDTALWWRMRRGRERWGCSKTGNLMKAQFITHGETGVRKKYSDISVTFSVLKKKEKEKRNQCCAVCVRRMIHLDGEIIVFAFECLQGSGAWM